MNRALTLRAKLLVAEYGRERVIAALSEIEGVEFDAIEQELDAHKERRAARRPRRPKTLTELLEESRLDPQRLALVRQIGCAYENKRYLPELWRVRRFLESRGVATGNLRSRAAALPLVVEVLNHLPLDELTDVLTEAHGTAKGNLGILADQILGPARNNPRSADRIPNKLKHR